MRTGCGHKKKMINTPKIYKMRIVFRVLEESAEQLNVFNAVRKMVLASGLPIEPAKVNPRWPRLAYGPAPAKGQRAEREYLDIYLRTLCSEAAVQQALVKVAPKGLELVQVTRVPYPLPSVQNLAAAVRYRVKGDFSRFNLSGRKIEDWAEAGNLTVTLRSQNGMSCQKDLAPGLLNARTVAPDEIALTLVPINGKWVSPQWFIAAWLGIEIPAQEELFELEGLIFIRQNFYWKDSQGELHPM